MNETRTTFSFRSSAWKAGGVLFLLLAVNLLAPMPCAAQNFKEGDRVQVRIGSGWYPGQIVGIVNGGYQVMVDGKPVTLPDDQHSGSGPYVKRDGGTLPAAEPGKQGSVPPSDPQGRGPGGKGAVPQDRPCIDCGKDAPAGKNGDAPPVAELTRLLQCIWERPPQLAGTDGAVTVDVRSLTLRGQRRNGDGPRDSAGRFTDPLTTDPDRIIHLFDGSYVKKTFYRERTRVEDVSQQVFEAYVGMDNKWHLRHASGPYTHREYTIAK